MSTAFRVTVLLICTLAWSLTPTTAAADTREEIAAVLDYYAEIWNEGDLDALRGYYHADFKLITANGVSTTEQRLADVTAVAESGTDRGELRHGELEIQELGDKHALAYGQLNLRFKDGSSIDGWFSTVFVNTPFGWKALLTHN